MSRNAWIIFVSLAILLAGFAIWQRAQPPAPNALTPGAPTAKTSTPKTGEVEH